MDESKFYCNCNSSMENTRVKKHLQFNVDFLFASHEEGEFCPVCYLRKWKYISEKGFLAQKEYDDNPPEIITQDQKVIKANGQRYSLYCLCNSISPIKNSYNYIPLVEGTDYEFPGYGKMSGFKEIICNKCNEMKWVYISARGCAAQIRHETIDTRPLFCACNSNMDFAVYFFEKDVEETDEQCPVCGYFKYYFITASGFKNHKKWKEGSHGHQS